MSSATLPPMEYQPEVLGSCHRRTMCALFKLIHHAGIEKVLVITAGAAGANGVNYLEDHGVEVERVNGPRDPRATAMHYPMKSRSESLLVQDVSSSRLAVLLTRARTISLSRSPPKSAHCTVRATTSSSSHPARLPSPARLGLQAP